MTPRHGTVPMPEGFWARPDMTRALLTWDIPAVLAAVLRELRWSQRQLAEVLGFSQSWVSNVLRREQSVTTDLGHAIAVKFGAPLPDHTGALAIEAQATPSPGEPAPRTIQPGPGQLAPARPARTRLAQQPAATPAPREEPREELARLLATWADTATPNEQSSRRLMLAQSLASSEAPAQAPLPKLADAIRREIEDTLTSGTVTPARLAQAEEIIASHVRSYTTTTPAAALARLLLDFMDIRRLLAERQPALVQGRLSEMAALLATLAADALMKLGHISQADAWYGTARMAADDSGNRELRARVRAQQAMLPYYYGHPAEAVRLARDAQDILGSVPRAAGALAAAAEARAEARMGRRPEAEAAMARAQNLAEQVHEPDDDQAFRFGERRHLFYLSGTLTNLGQADQAGKVQAAALTLYGDTTTLIDPALIRLDQAQMLIYGHDLQGACALIRDACLSIAPQFRTQLLSARARQIAHATPHDSPQRHALGTLIHELLTTRPG